ncbi:MAG TPA: BMP family ABC transporter substrate-binding protein [Herpetosiphonaceae bacterium]
MFHRSHAMLAIVLLCLAQLAGCGGSAATPAPAPARQKVAVVLPQGTADDKGFNEFTVKGAREAAAAAGVDFAYLPSQTPADVEKNIETLVAEGTDAVIAMGFITGDAIAQAARRHPEVRFITDTAYAPGFGCAEQLKDCYSAEGGLSNVTSLSFAEDEVGYLAGVLAGCMSQSGTIASVAGLEIPPVERFVIGYQAGARSVRPDIATLNQYIPDFNDSATGKVVGLDFISQGADVIFVAAGNTGNGALLAATESGKMAIGVDVDQYLTYPEVKGALLSSAKKNVDVAVGAAVSDFAAGKLASGIRLANVANGGVGLAPYHEWETKISAECKANVTAAEQAIKANPAITGAK